MLHKEGIKEAPEFNPKYHQWSAVFEASYLGEAKSLEVLIEAGANINQPLEYTHYQSKSYIGSTPLNVAKDKTVKELLLLAGAKEGKQSKYAIYLETRGEKEQVQRIIKEAMQVSASKADELWLTVKKEMGKIMEEIDGRYVIYLPLFLKCQRIKTK